MKPLDIVAPFFALLALLLIMIWRIESIESRVTVLEHSMERK